ncbi:hypothetical protein LINGRAHAP2_LOCUS20684 [Linum grandiflorum]
MVEIFSEMSVSHGLLYSGIDGVITVYMTCIVNDEEFAGDNMTEGVGVQDRGADGDEEIQRSVAEGGLIHLIDDSDRTTDPEFYEALNNLGILGLRRKFRSQRADGGEEVDQVYEEMEASTGLSNHGPVNTGPAPTRQAEERDVQQALRGVGAYVSPETGNTYYRGSIARDEVLDARGSQPPVTQPSE